MRMDVHQVNDLLQALQDQRNALANENAMLRAELAAARRKIHEMESRHKSSGGDDPLLKPFAGDHAQAVEPVV